MSEVYRSHCPLDCPDVCSYEVTVQDGKIHKVSGTKNHLYTKGFVCSKAQKQVARMYSPDRITSPLRRSGDSFVKISWEDALAQIAEKLVQAKEKSGPTSVLYYTEEGSAGLLRGLEERFFKSFGGATFTDGSLCWGAVSGAQKLDFGEYRAHLWEDMLHSKTVVLWGRNIAETNIHMVPFVRGAQINGAFVIAIDPIKTKTASLADSHIALRPSTDGVFALSVAYVICDNDWADLEFVSKHTANFKEYLAQVKKYPPSIAAEITGIPEADIIDFAKRYATEKPACIWLGYGMQRYNDSGQTIRAIDALGALTGNIGIPGGGVNHASEYNKKIVSDISGSELASEMRYFKKGILAEEILNANPPIEVMITTSANPVTQLPNTSKTIEAFNTIPFKVVSDFFLTDTARLADIILPCASVFEKEDIIMSSWNPFIGYNPKIVEARGKAKADYEIFFALAKQMNMTAYESYQTEFWLNKALEAGEEYGITLETLQKEIVQNPLWEKTAWQDHVFSTSSGKFNFLNNFVMPRVTKGLRLLTSHQSGTMHSQFYNLLDNELNHPQVFISPDLAEKLYLCDMEKAIIETEFGNLTAIVMVSEDIHPECIVLHEGSCIHDGGGVNLLTGDSLSDIGNGTSYNEVMCKMRKVL